MTATSQWIAVRASGDLIVSNPLDGMASANPVLLLTSEIYSQEPLRYLFELRSREINDPG